MPKWGPLISRRALETESRDLVAQCVLTPGDVATLTRGNMHTDLVAEAIYDKRSARKERANAIKIFRQKLVPGADAAEQSAKS